MSHAASLQPPLLAAALSDYEALVGIARRNVRCHALAADVVQDVMVKLVRSEAKPLSEAERGAFLRVVIRNRAISLLRQRRREAAIFTQDDRIDDVADAAPDAERVVIGRQELRALVGAIEALPPRCREVFILHKFGGLTYSDAAARLGIAPNTVMVHMANALRALKACRNGFAPG